RAERAALLRVLVGLVVRAHRQPHRERRHRDATAVEDREELLESLAALAEQVLLGHLGVDERELARVRRAPAHLLVLLRTGEAGGVLRDDDVRDLFAAAVEAARPGEG